MATVKFTKALQGQAWERLQFAIKEQSQLTINEYDLPSLVARVANDMRRSYGLDYNKVCDYLEDRYTWDMEPEQD